MKMVNNQQSGRTALPRVLAAIAVAVVSLLATGCGVGNSAELCPVTGEKLGSMGDPFVVEHEGKQIKLCCEGCKEDFDKDPAKYAAKAAK